MSYAANVAPDQPAHPHSLSLELQCQLIHQRNKFLFVKVADGESLRSKYVDAQVMANQLKF